MLRVSSLAYVLQRVSRRRHGSQSRRLRHGNQPASSIRLRRHGPVDGSGGAFGNMAMSIFREPLPEPRILQHVLNFRTLFHCLFFSLKLRTHHVFHWISLSPSSPPLPTPPMMRASVSASMSVCTCICTHLACTRVSITGTAQCSGTALCLRQTVRRLQLWSHAVGALSLPGTRTTPGPLHICFSMHVRDASTLPPIVKGCREQRVQLGGAHVRVESTCWFEHQCLHCDQLRPRLSCLFKSS